MKDVPIYLVNGFIESGKTTLINETLRDKSFSEGGKTLLIVCEEGIEEYDSVELSKYEVEIISIEEPEELSTQLFEKCSKEVNPPVRVMIEYNGTWKMDTFLETDLPKAWVLGQVLTMVDGSTFGNYWNNMRVMMAEQFKYSDSIIFNRCDANTDRGMIRRQVKPLNRKAQIVYESKDGVLPDGEDEAPPFDFSKEPIVIDDDDFGIWYLDAMDYPDRYRNKVVAFKGLVYRDKKSDKDVFIPGRFAMTCCANDIAFFGFACHVSKKDMPMIQFNPKDRRWVYVTAVVQYEYCKEYKCEGPVLYAREVKAADKPKDEVVYFS